LAQPDLRLRAGVLSTLKMGWSCGSECQALKAADGAEADKEGKEQRCLDVLKLLQATEVNTTLLMETEAAKKLKRCTPIVYGQHMTTNPPPPSPHHRSAARRWD
jgi:hypothetical protein